MKKRLFMALQMFAEDPAGTDPAGNDPAGGQNPAGADPKATEPKNEPEKKYTDEDVDRIINQKFAQKFSEWEKKQSKAKDEAEKLAGMNAEQKEKYENEQLKKQVQDLLRKDALGKMATVARGMLGEKSKESNNASCDTCCGEYCYIQSPKTFLFSQAIDRSYADADKKQKR